jgi:hypothetical protein
VSTLRYRASTRLPYAMALTDLFEYAHDHPDPDFVFGPTDLEQLESSGLAVSGKDLSSVGELLSRVAGLVPDSP